MLNIINQIFEIEKKSKDQDISIFESTYLERIFKKNDMEIAIYF